MTYNMTELAAADTVYDLMVYANNSTGSILLALFVMAVFFVMLMVLKKWDFDSALLVSSFSCFVLSAILVYAHLLALVWALVFLIMAGFTAFYMVVLRGG